MPIRKLGLMLMFAMGRCGVGQQTSAQTADPIMKPTKIIVSDSSSRRVIAQCKINDTGIVHHCSFKNGGNLTRVMQVVYQYGESKDKVCEDTLHEALNGVQQMLKDAEK